MRGAAAPGSFARVGNIVFGKRAGLNVGCWRVCEAVTAAKITSGGACTRGASITGGGRGAILLGEGAWLDGILRCLGLGVVRMAGKRRNRPINSA